MGDKVHCFHFAYECRQKWDGLAATDTADVRHCAICRENVYWCGNDGDAIERHAREGHCVAVQTSDGIGLGDPDHSEAYRSGTLYTRRVPRAFG